MGSRKESFVGGEVYHCFNRGVDKRDVFTQAEEFSYFLKSLYFLNDADDAHRMREREKFDYGTVDVKYVEILAYCLNPNHFHLLVISNADNAVSKFMQKLLTSYTMYFNQKHERSGSLFQGKFKSRHVETDEYLQHLLVYVAANNFVHGITDAQNYRSNYESLSLNQKIPLCDPEQVHAITDLGMSFDEFAQSRLSVIVEMRELEKEMVDSVFID